MTNVLSQAEAELAIYAKVYELLLDAPIASAFREADDGPEGEPPPLDPEMVVAVQADRFDLMSRVRKLRQAAQQDLRLGPDFTETGRDALLWVLWHHQGGSSPVGQPLRFALGMGQHDDLSEHQIAAAKRWAEQRTAGVVDATAPQRVDAPPLPQLTDGEIDGLWNRMGSFSPNDHRYFAREIVKAAYGSKGGAV